MSDSGPINYCLITASFRQSDGANRTGWATYAETMADCLRRGGVRVTVVVIHEAIDTGIAARDASPDMVHLQLRWVYLASLLLPGFVEGLQLLRAVRKLDRERHFDVIEGPNVAGICWALAVWFDRRFLVRVHTSLVAPRGELPQQRTWREVFKWRLDVFTGRSARLVVTHSQAHAATVAGQYGIRETNIVLVPHAVPDPGPTLPGNPHRILAIANAVRRKGVDILLEAFAQVHAKVPDAELVIVGTTPGDLERMLAAVSRPAETLAARIHALGPIADESLDLEWQRAGVVVVPSRYESFGLVAVEGMARGKAVIVSNGGALAEVVGDGGIVVAPEDADALALAVVEVLNSPDRRAELGVAGRRRYERCYRPEELTRRMGDLIAKFRAGSRVVRLS